MNRQLFGLALAGAAVIAAIFSITQSHVTVNAATIEMLGIDIPGLTISAKDLVDHQYPTH